MANKTTDFSNRKIVSKSSLLLKLSDSLKCIVYNEG